MYKLSVFFIFIVTSGCVTVPVTVASDYHECEMSSDLKTLKVINVANETNSYYSISGVLLSPILVPTTAIISGTYVLVNNIYHLGEDKYKCGDILI
jgi:hypothetical protein